MIHKALLIIILFNGIFSAQTISSNNDLFSPSNVKKFADFLFEHGEFLRAAGEYRRYLRTESNDTVAFKLGEAYLRTNYYSGAATSFKALIDHSTLSEFARLKYLQCLFLSNDFNSYRNSFEKVYNGRDSAYYLNALSLYHFSYLFSEGSLPAVNDFLSPYLPEDKKELELFYKWKENPPLKSPFIAALMSAFVPGAGKFYTHFYADGIVAFLTTGILSYIAYTDFRASHKIRAWIFTGLAAGFYAGNIYGSAASAQLFNAKFKFDFIKSLKDYLDKVDYFLPIIKFLE